MQHYNNIIIIIRKTAIDLKRISTYYIIRRVTFEAVCYCKFYGSQTYIMHTEVLNIIYDIIYCYCRARIMWRLLFVALIMLFFFFIQTGRHRVSARLFWQ